MILWSVVPTESVFQDVDSDEKTPAYRELHVGPATMIVEPTGGSEGRIVRLVSPRPSDYLNPNWMPGCVVTLPSDPTLP